VILKNRQTCIRQRILAQACDGGIKLLNRTIYRTITSQNHPSNHAKGVRFSAHHGFTAWATCSAEYTLNCAVHCCAVHTFLTVQYNAVQCYVHFLTVQCNTVQCEYILTVHLDDVQCCVHLLTVQYNAVQCCVLIFDCAVQCCALMLCSAVYIF